MTLPAAGNAIKTFALNMFEVAGLGFRVLKQNCRAISEYNTSGSNEGIKGTFERALNCGEIALISAIGVTLLPVNFIVAATAAVANQGCKVANQGCKVANRVYNFLSELTSIVNEPTKNTEQSNSQ